MSTRAVPSVPGVPPAPSVPGRTARPTPDADRGSHASLLNKMRAAVLGANDGIVSTAGMVVGVAGATADSFAILAAGVAGLTAGALSMAVGEFVSVSAQRDTERALLDRERRALEEAPGRELAELAAVYTAKGLSPEVSGQVARQLTARDALRAHAEARLGIDPDELTSPTAAAVSSAISFVVGAIIPLLAMVLTTPALRLPATVAAVVAALVLTGLLSSRAGGSPAGRAVARNVTGGLVAMAVTYAIGTVVGVFVG